MKQVHWLLLSLAAIGVFLGTLFISTTHNAQADDAWRTTVVGAATFDYDGSGAEASVDGTITSTNNGDTLLLVELFVTPNGGTEAAAGSASSPRGANGAFWVTASINSGRLNSGDTVRAVFRAYDNLSVETFNYTRSYTKP